jgi:cyclase
VQKITENVYVETGFHGCNVSFVVTKEGIVMIDSPMVPAEAAGWRDTIAGYGRLRYLINSEPHIDHFAGNCFFDCTVVAHVGAREVILEASTEQLKDMLKTMAPDSLPLPDDFHFCPPVITFSQRLNLHLGEHSFRLFHLPGHSPFQAAVYVPEERVIVTSDNVVNGTPPFMHQALPYEWLESLKQMQQLDADVLVPGHGDVCDPGYLPTMIDTVQTWIDAVLEAIDKGMSLEEAQEKITVLDTSDEHNMRVHRMNIGHLYEVLKK